MRARLLLILLLSAGASAYAEAPLHDPTVPPSHGGAWIQEKKPTKPDWLLTSILISPARRLATIDGRSVTVGDEVSGGRVVAIDAGTAVLRYKGKNYQLSLLPATPHINVKRPVDP